MRLLYIRMTTWAIMIFNIVLVTGPLLEQEIPSFRMGSALLDLLFFPIFTIVAYMHIDVKIMNGKTDPILGQVKKELKMTALVTASLVAIVLIIDHFDLKW